MSAANVETVRRLYEEHLADPARIMEPRLLEFFAEDVVIEQSASLLGTQGIFEGHAGLAAAAREAFDTFREVHYARPQLTDAGDDVLALVEFRALGRESDVAITETVGHLWTLQGGKIVRWRVFFDLDEARAAAGLAP